MKFIISLLAIGFASSAFATIDMQGSATIVVKNVQTDEYFTQSVPTNYCVGIDSLTLAEAITQPVVIKANYGCGQKESMVYDQQVNEATCVEITATEVSNADGSFNPETVKVESNFSKCGDKIKDPGFIKAVEQAVYNSYKSKGYKITSYSEVK